MATWTLADIGKEVRQLTGRLTEDDLSNAALYDKINKYYQYVLPADLRLERNLTYCDLLTSANQAYYTAPTGYTNFQPPALVDMMLIEWYQEPMSFLMNNPMSVTSSNPWTGDGVTVAFTTTLQQKVVFPGTLIITDNTEVFSDTNTTWTSANVFITGSLGGTAMINYATGVVSVIFNTAPVANQTIRVSYSQATYGRPQAVLWYNNQFQFYPIPDSTYRFRVKAYSVPPAMTLATSRPLLDEWGPCIAYGTALDIVPEFGEMDTRAGLEQGYNKRLDQVNVRTLQNFSNVRALPGI